MVTKTEQFGFDQWQKDVDEAKGNIAVRAGRQVGKSTIIAKIAADYAANNPNKLVMIIAHVERQAYLLFEKVMHYADDHYRSKVKGGKDRPTKSLIRFRNGSKIYCLPTGMTGHGVRGFTIDLLIADEAAFIPEEVFDSIIPAISTRISKGARVILLSTPFGREGFFPKAFNDPTYTTFHISAEDCPRHSQEFLDYQKETKSKRVYAQEYLGEFVDDLMQFFPDKLIKECMKRKRPGNITKGNNFLGVDLARMGDDESTFEVIKIENNKLIHTENQITTRTYLNESTNHILALHRLYDFKKIFIDDEGIGVGVYDYLLENVETRRQIVPINNSKRILDRDETQRTRLLKEDLYNNLLMLLETGKIELLDDPEVFQSLKSVQFDYSKDTLGKSHLKIFGNYTHIVEGLIRAAWCVKYKGLNTWIDYV